MCIMVPADHVRESIIAMHLRIIFKMTLKKIPICKGNRFKIILLEHHGSPWNKSGICLSMGLNPKDV
jgi:hypothetical protein